MYLSFNYLNLDTFITNRTLILSNNESASFNYASMARAGFTARSLQLPINLPKSVLLTSDFYFSPSETFRKLFNFWCGFGIYRNQMRVVSLTRVKPRYNQRTELNKILNLKSFRIWCMLKQVLQLKFEVWRSISLKWTPTMRWGSIFSSVECWMTFVNLSGELVLIYR